MNEKEYVKLIKDLHESNEQFSKECEIDPGEGAHDTAYSIIRDEGDQGSSEIVTFLRSKGVTDPIGRFADDIFEGTTYFK